MIGEQPVQKNWMAVGGESKDFRNILVKDLLVTFLIKPRSL